MFATTKIRYIDQSRTAGEEAAAHDYLYSESVLPDPDGHWASCELSKYCDDSEEECHKTFLIHYRGMWNALRGMDKACAECGIAPRRPNWSNVQRIIS
jgi:hypothetical protein